MNDTPDMLLTELPKILEASEGIREIVFANLAMIGEAPAPTYREDQRVEALLQRLSEFGLHNCSRDEMGNASGILPGQAGGRNILVVSNVDTFADADPHPHVEIRSDHILGPFVGDNSLALAAIVSLPFLLDKLNLKLESNLILLGAARSLGRGNLEGLKYFLANSSVPIHYGLCVESVQLGRLNYSCLGMLRGEIVCRLPEDYNWARFGATGAIIPMSDIISRISKIPVPKRPLTRIVIGSLRGGISHQNIARQTTLGFEVRSESGEILNQIRQELEDIGEEVAAQAGVRVRLDIFARREPGGLKISHPLVRACKTILSGLGIEPMLYATTTQLAAFLEKNIPAVTLGVSTGERKFELEEIEELVDAKKIPIGLAQLAAAVLAIDRGWCNGE